MLNYIVKRLFLIIPTLFGILAVNFLIIQAAPGGPVEKAIAQIKGTEVSVTEKFTTSGGEQSQSAQSQTKLNFTESKYRGSQGIDPDLIKELEKQYGFDKPPIERFFEMLKNYLVFDFGESFYKDKTVIDLIIEKLPVSISLGLWTTLFIYLISIPLGIRKAVQDGSKFDIYSSSIIIVGYAIPGFLFAIFLIVIFAGGSYLDIFPLRGLVSDDWDQLSFVEKILDYFWHLTLPVLAMVIGGFASLTMLTKNSFLDEINKQYVITARAKGVSEKKILYGHIFRNAMLIVISGFPAAFINILFTSSLLIEVIFSLDGLGLLGFEAALGRDYPVVFGSLYIFTLIGLLLRLISDLTYVLIDPRIDFESRGGAMNFSPLTQRRLKNFMANKRGLISTQIFCILFFLSIFAEFVANDKPIFLVFKGNLHLPVFEKIPETYFGGEFETEADYKDPFVKDLIKTEGFYIMPFIEYSYDTINYDLKVPSPSPPTLDNLLGTDDQGRDVLARLIYGFRISVFFGLILTVLSSVIGIVAGGIQGYYGGKIDLFGQRFIEIWSGLPVLYLLIIISSFVEPSFWILLFIMLLFSWMSLEGVVRAEFLRARNFEYVKAAKALGLSNPRIMLRHVLPNAMVATLTLMPFILSGSIATLTSLDFLGFGLPPGSPSLGEMVAQGKSNLQAPWLGLSAFITLSLQLSLLVFIGEAVRDAFDPRKVI